MNNRIFPFRPWLIVLAGSVVAPLCNTATPAVAQRKAGRAPLPVLPAAPAGVAVAPVAAIPVNVLILAMEDVPDSVLMAPPMTAPGNRTIRPSTSRPKTPSPIRPIPPAIAPAIAPAAWPRLQSSQIIRVASAKKKPKVAPDPNRFKLTPEPWTTYTAPAPNPLVAPVADLPNAPAASSNGFDDDFSVPASRANGNGDFSTTRSAGPVEAASAPLRRALLRNGFSDVLSTPLDGNAVQRIVNNRRLSARVLDTLRRSTRQWLDNTAARPAAAGDAAPKVDDDGAAVSANLITSASRVGQALGYRAVVVMAMAPLGAAAEANKRGATYALMIVDAQQEIGDPLVFEESGDSEIAANEAAAAAGAAIITRNAVTWPVLSAADKKARADKYFADARIEVARKDYAAAQDSLNQVLAFDPNRADAFVLLYDMMQASDPTGAIQSMRDAVKRDDKNGETWAKLAVALTVGPTPQWPRALDAGRSALALGWDTAVLRQAMATSQLGIAQLFRNAGRDTKAQAAETEARVHLDRALELAPDDPTTSRLMTQQFLQQGRIAEALQLLDRIAVQYPDDAEIQNQYALALLQTEAREEDAFVAWARARKLGNDSVVEIDATNYRRLAEGFDRRMANLGKRADQLAGGVAANNTPREGALMQLARFKEDMTDALSAIKAIPPGMDGQSGNGHASRLFAADLLSQSLESYQLYLETGQELYRTRAKDSHRTAIVMINSARTASRQ